MQTSPDMLSEPAPRSRAKLVQIRVGPRTSSNPASIEGMVACFAITAGGLGATAAMGGLRVADLAISGVVMIAMFVLAMRDSRYLAVAAIAAWMFVPLVRRIVDWESGGYTSVTALSLLPMMATSALIIPLYRRLRLLPRALIEPLLLMGLPVLAASAVGVVRYGPSAVVEAAGWLLPLLFLPYLATRPAAKAERWWLLRAAVLMAALAAVYGLYQFFVLPIWDRLWLYESGMMSSMGRPVPMEIRVWGPLNGTGTAAAVWALAVVTAFADRTWRPALRYPVIGLLVVALCLTFVRMGWVMVVAGVVAQVALSGRREGLSIVISAGVVGLTLWFALPFIPQGEKVMDRFVTFSDLENDGSYNARKLTTQAMAQAVMDKPLGVGMGYATAAKVSGQSNAIEAVDSGYADMFLTLGWIGGAAYASGMVRLFWRSWRSTGGRRDASRAWVGELGAIACACLVAVAICTFASFSMVAIVAAWTSCCLGVAAVPLAAAIRPARVA